MEHLNTNDASVADIPSVVNLEKNGTDKEEVKEPTICDVRNSDLRSCSVHSNSSSNKWSIVDEQQRYRESGQNRYGNTDASVSSWDTSVADSVGPTSRAVVVPTTARKNDDDDDDQTTVSITGASSTICGFDIISLNGTSSQRACQNCTLLNRYDSLFCEACATPLQSNPCPDADAILAQQLQDEENKYAFSLVKSKETKRKSMFVKQPLIVQAREFKKDVYCFVNEFKNCKTVSSLLKNDTIGYELLPEVSMVILASRFIETMTTNHRLGKNADVLIRYCVTPKWGGQFRDSVKENAFPPNSFFSLDFGLALRSRNEHFNTWGLGAIPEDVVINPTNSTPMKPLNNAPCTALKDNIGWIAAIVKGDDTTDHWNHLDKCYTIVPNPNQTVPLLCFDASLYNKSATEYLFNGLIRVCNDFFDTMKEQLDEEKMMIRGRQHAHCNNKKARSDVDATSIPEVVTNDTDPSHMVEDSSNNNINVTHNKDDHDDDDDDDNAVDVIEDTTSDFAKYGSSSIMNDSDSD
jgi:hypothetical protein